jgi:hypothetical protein
MIRAKNPDGTYECTQDGRIWSIPARSVYAQELATWQDMPEPSDAEVLEMAKQGRVHPYYAERELACANLLANVQEIDAFEGAVTIDAKLEP